MKQPVRHCYLAMSVLAFLGPVSVPTAWAAEEHAVALLQGMSDFLSSQPALAVDFDATFEVVTDEGQKLGLASSGSVALARPDRIRARRHGGFIDVETIFDGTTLTLLGRTANVYTQVELPGSIDHLIDELRDTYGRPLPAADLLAENPFEGLMEDVVDVKDLGSGVIGGVECDWLAFRKNTVDWQIWIAQGDRPYPCRYAITTREVMHAPQYTIDFFNWRFGEEVDADFDFESPTGVVKIEPAQLSEHISDLPEHFSVGEQP